MTVWDDLKRVIARLSNEQPAPLLGYRDPGRDGGRQPPFAIHLAPWAAATAADVFDQFGGDVHLTVGALPFPPGAAHEPRPALRRRADPLDPGQAAAELDGPAVVRSGHTLRHGLLVRNRSSDEIKGATNGAGTPVVVEPAPEQGVGWLAGAQTLPLVVFAVAPGATERIPLLIVPASFEPELSYTGPA